MKPEDKKFALNLFLEIVKVPDRSINTQVKYFSEALQTIALFLRRFSLFVSTSMFQYELKNSSTSEVFYHKRMNLPLIFFKTPFNACI